MPTLQVRDLPEDVYNQLSYLAEKEHRSLSQETIVILKEGIVSKLGDRDRRRILLEDGCSVNSKGMHLPDPAVLIREDRDR